jgi:hypothetical protein
MVVSPNLIHIIPADLKICAHQQNSTKILKRERERAREESKNIMGSSYFQPRLLDLKRIFKMVINNIVMLILVLNNCLKIAIMMFIMN